ncbi:hypothetical protein [Balneatrix alpica]|uniref:Uncharacterized protein n=1 Tax=Balneatrix alpica TaxID=75684 RepID=A0ABV5ZC96_9GAMM|nr:hypothetical protein [Balneatrix alpica]
MKVDFEEKTYESYFNNELDSKSSVYFPPGQVLEGLLGFDAASNSNNRDLWRKLGYPFWFFPHFAGVSLLDIAHELEQELDHFIDKIPNIKANIFLQYKRPEYITTSNGKEWHHWQAEYFRYHIYTSQHQILSKIDQSFGDKALVLYASPAIKSMSELVSLKKNREIINNSNFQKSSKLNNHSKNTYTQAGTHSIACSKPEMLENIDLVSELRRIEATHDMKNKQFITHTSQVITNNMESSKVFRELMAEYKEYKEYSLIYAFLTMKVFREITGVQWALSIQA